MTDKKHKDTAENETEEIPADDLYTSLMGKLFNLFDLVSHDQKQVTERMKRKRYGKKN